MPNESLRSEPPVTAPLTLADRDAKLEAIMRTIEILLYQAREAHSLGVASCVPFDALPQAWRRDLADAARAVVMHESLPRRQDADVHARAAITRWLQAAAVTALDTAKGLRTDDRFVVQAALDRFITALTTSLGPSVVSEVLHHYQASLCGPETRAPRAQVARAVLAAPPMRGGR